MVKLALLAALASCSSSSSSSSSEAPTCAALGCLALCHENAGSDTDDCACVRRVINGRVRGGERCTRPREGK